MRDRAEETTSRAPLSATYAIVIPTMLPMRKQMLADLLAQLAELAPDVHVAVSAHDDAEPVRNDWVRALQLGAVAASEWTMYLEDDAYLAGVFDEVVRQTLANAGDTGHRLVSFYSDNRRLLRAAAEGRTTCVLPARYLWSTVCIAVHTADVESIAEFAPAWYASHPEHWHASDLVLGAWCDAAGSDVLVAVPSPVQHRDPPSTLGHNVARRRISRTFRRATGRCPTDPEARSSQASITEVAIHGRVGGAMDRLWRMRCQPRKPGIFARAASLIVS